MRYLPTTRPPERALAREGDHLFRDFFARVSVAQTAVLMLDYDGTLAPFSSDPHRAHPYPRIGELIDTIMAQTATRVVIISGRWLRDLVGLLSFKHQPELWGSHGRERLLPTGEYTFAELDADATHALLQVDSWELGLRRLGARMERKPSGLAVHWRGLSAERVALIAQHLNAAWNAIRHPGSLELREFNGGMEVVARGCTKARAVEVVLGESLPDAVVAYLGDDLTDEDAFEALRGRGLGVLVARTQRATAAQALLRPPHEVRGFLQQWTRSRTGG